MSFDFKLFEACIAVLTFLDETFSIKFLAFETSASVGAGKLHLLQKSQNESFGSKLSTFDGDFWVSWDFSNSSSLRLEIPANKSAVELISLPHASFATGPSTFDNSSEICRL